MGRGQGLGAGPRSEGQSMRAWRGGMRVRGGAGVKWGNRGSEGRGQGSEGRGRVGGMAKVGGAAEWRRGQGNEGRGRGCGAGPRRGAVAGAHLCPPVGPPPERTALGTVVLRTPPDAWFGKKEWRGAASPLTAWRCNARAGAPRKSREQPRVEGGTEHDGGRPGAPWARHSQRGPAPGDRGELCAWSLNGPTSWAQGLLA